MDVHNVGLFLTVHTNMTHYAGAGDWMWNAFAIMHAWSKAMCRIGRYYNYNLGIHAVLYDSNERIPMH